MAVIHKLDRDVLGKAVTEPSRLVALYMEWYITVSQQEMHARAFISFFPYQRMFLCNATSDHVSNKSA